jgi:hypothetical protein
MPIELHGDMERSGMTPQERDLNVAAWSHSAFRMSDGKLLPIEVKRLPSWNALRVRRLVEAGYWRPTVEGYEIVGYLEINRSREEIEERRAGNRLRQHAFRERRTADRAEPATPEMEPSNALGNAGSHASRDAASPNHHLHLDREQAKAKGMVERKDDPFPLDWSSEHWRLFRNAWEGRGLREPPSQGQLRRFSNLIAEFPDEIPEFVRRDRSSGPSTFAILAGAEEMAKELRAQRRQPATALGSARPDEVDVLASQDLGDDFPHPGAGPAL